MGKYSVRILPNKIRISIYLDRLAVLPDILARAAVLVPQQPSSLEVFSLGSPHHPGQQYHYAIYTFRYIHDHDR